MLARVTAIFTVSDFSFRFVRVHLAYLFFACLIIAYCMCFFVGHIIQRGVIEVISIRSPCCTYALLDPILGISYHLRQFQGQGYVVFSPNRQRYAFITHNWYDNVTLFVVDRQGVEHSPQPLMNAEIISAIAWSADGEHLAYSALLGGLQHIYTFDLNTGTINQITPYLRNCTLPAWSPDERYIVGLCEDESSPGRGVYRIDRLVNNTERIADEVGSIQCLQWAPDGIEIVIQAREVTVLNQTGVPAHLYSMNLDGSNLHVLAPTQFYVASFAWSPDSTHILFLASIGTALEKSLFLMNRDGSNVEQLAVPIERYVARITWYAGDDLSW
ncbi:MAG: hypothetical protein U0694_00965 [Anaerolineae bacterium]